MGKEFGPESHIDLPPGFRFYPTDEELVVHYLSRKAASQPFAVPIIAEIDLYKFDPWDLPEKALFGEKEWYFFSPRDRKYPNGSRPNRAAASGYWKATGTDKPITSGGCKSVGVKKALVFYKGRAPKGVKTNWIMHEYRLADSASRAAKRKGSLRLDDWVLCRIYKKLYGAQKSAAMSKQHDTESSCQEDVLASLPEVDGSKLAINLPRINSLNRISSWKSAMQYDHKDIQQMMQPNRAADNIPCACGGNRQATNDDTELRNSVMCCANLTKNRQKEQHSNGATDADTAVVTDASGHNLVENQNVYLGSGAPSLLQMGPRVEMPWMSMDTQAEEEVQSSFRLQHNAERLVQPAPSSVQQQLGFGEFDHTQSPFLQLESIASLGDGHGFFASLAAELLQRPSQ